MATAASAVVLAQDSPSTITVNLLPAVGAADDGCWFETGPYSDGSITVAGITTATIKVCGSDGDSTGAKPANSAHGSQIGANITADGIFDLVRAPRWIKAYISAWTSGTAITVKATLRKPGGR